MERNNTKGSNIGQFNYMKGFGVIGIVMEHTFGLFAPLLLLSNDVSRGAFYVLLRLTASVVMPAFFIISGFGFRKESPLKSIKKQAKYLLIPYGIVMFFACGFHLVIHYTTFHYLKGSIIETIKVFGGFLLGAGSNINIGHWTFFANGACWYLLTMFISWNVLQFIYKYAGKFTMHMVILTVLTGWGLSVLSPQFVFCIPQSLIAVGYLYLGYEIKKKRWMFEPLQTWKYIVLIAVSLITIIFGFDIMASNIWRLGIIDMVASAAYALLLIRLTLRLSSKKGKFLESIAYLGRISLWIICVHTVEFIAVPWYLIVEKLGNNFGTYFLILACRTIIIVAGIFVIKSYTTLKKRWEK